MADRLAASPDRPTALFAVNDILATALLRALAVAGLRVPEDISVLGFDDVENMGLHPPVLTTVRQPYERIGAQAARLLLSRRRAPDAPFRSFLLETALIQRNTTRPIDAESEPQAATGGVLSALDAAGRRVGL
jgi:DNA-binding LacI/PurR family transcriptional regulator